MNISNLKRRILSFCRKETVLCISLALALLSLFAVPPSMQYLAYIDFRVLALLFCLMTVVAGWQKVGAFYRLGIMLSRKANTLREITAIVVGLCFFSGMFITNDVALITFVPFTIALFTMADCGDRLIFVIVLETIAANLGSMLTPIGNPQNLFLFSLSKMSVWEFILHMFPLAAVSFAAILLAIWLKPNRAFPAIQSAAEREAQGDFCKTKTFWVSSILFLVCLSNVFHLLPYPAVLTVVILAIAIFDRTLFKAVDYCLLLTFVALFVFIGNMGQIGWIRQLLEQMISGRELAVGILSSQIISNVPAAMLLSGFTSCYGDLLWGVNIGGLGTMIASMASLISYKYYVTNSPAAQKGKYMAVFTKYNIIFLLLLVGTALLLKV